MTPRPLPPLHGRGGGAEPGLLAAGAGPASRSRADRPGPEAFRAGVAPTGQV